MIIGKKVRTIHRLRHNFPLLKQYERNPNERDDNAGNLVRLRNLAQQQQTQQQQAQQASATATQSADAASKQAFSTCMSGKGYTNGP